MIVGFRVQNLARQKELRGKAAHGTQTVDPTRNGLAYDFLGKVAREARSCLDEMIQG